MVVNPQVTASNGQRRSLIQFDDSPEIKVKDFGKLESKAKL